jgi:hypothetical protein
MNEGDTLYSAGMLDHKIVPMRRTYCCINLVQLTRKARGGKERGEGDKERGEREESGP